MFSTTHRFIQVETYFFWMWWSAQDESKRREVKQLVSEGRLEFIGGGWSMNDEAAAHYNAIIDNMASGFLELKEHFGDNITGGSIAVLIFKQKSD